MKKFEEPKFNVITFASPDVITTSGGEILEPNKDGYTNNNDEYNILDNFFL